MISNNFKKKEQSIGNVVDNIFQELGDNYIFCDGKVLDSAGYEVFFDKLKQNRYGTFGNGQSIQLKSIFGFKPISFQYPKYVNGYFCMIAEDSSYNVYLAYTNQDMIEGQWSKVKIGSASQNGKNGFSYIPFISGSRYSSYNSNATTISYVNNTWVVAINFTNMSDQYSQINRCQYVVGVWASSSLQSGWSYKGNIIDNNSSNYYFCPPSDVVFSNGVYYCMVNSCLDSSGNNRSFSIYKSTNLSSWRSAYNPSMGSGGWGLWNQKIKITDDNNIMFAFSATDSRCYFGVFDINSNIGGINAYGGNNNYGVDCYIDIKEKKFVVLCGEYAQYITTVSKKTYEYIKSGSSISFSNSDSVFIESATSMSVSGFMGDSQTGYINNSNSNYKITDNGMVKVDSSGGPYSQFYPYYIGGKYFYSPANYVEWNDTSIFLIKYIENSTPPLNKYVLAR